MMFLTPNQQAVTIWLQIVIFSFFESLSSVVEKILLFLNGDWSRILTTPPANVPHVRRGGK